MNAYDLWHPQLHPDPSSCCASRSSEEEDALCAVCGEGHSEPPNQILFCERCDVGVHQSCYGVAEIPEGEWLCCPCLAYEEQQRAAGVPAAEIRPPRYALGVAVGCDEFH